ncbi:MAG: tetratricopeptide repeat protein [Bacteroidales bacterium]|nr:tetratricopeptide repeat protein [Bacteroidales bacterium]
MKKCLIVILFLFITSNLMSQNKSEIDSLKALLKDSKEDTTTVIFLNKIAYSFYHFDPDSTFKYANKALFISSKINYYLGKIKAYRMIGLAYSGKSEYDQALKYLFLSLKEAERTKNLKYISIVYISIGIVYRKKSEYDEALKYYLKSLEISELKKDSLHISFALNNIGIIYMALEDYDKAIEYYTESLYINKKTGNRKSVPYTLANIGLIYKEKNELDKSIAFLKEALTIFEEYNFKNEIGNANANLGEIYLLQKKYQEAFNSIQTANKIYSETGDKAGRAETFLILGNIYLNQKKYGAAESALSLGMEICKEIGYKEYIIDSYLYLSKLDSARNNYKSALDYYKKYSQLKDSVFSKEKNKAISEIQGKYNLAETERENIVLRKDKQINEIKIKRQKLLNYSVGSVLILMLFVVFLIIYSYKKLKNANQLLKSKNEEISSQNISLEEYKEKIESQYEEIRNQNEKLEIYKNELETLVDERTTELNKALVSAKESDRLKTEFLENLSHEVRTPMNAISGFSSIIAKDKFNFKPEYLYGIHKGMDDLVNTIDRLVIFSRFQLEQYEINIENIKLEDYFDEIKQMIFNRKSFLKKEDINIEFDIDYKNLPELFVCDKFVLNSIIKELIENAFKFTEKGTITVEVNGIDTGSLCIKVKDTGVGIKEDVISHVYDFMRKFDKENVLYRGMGVGLALVNRAVELLSGEIKIDSVYKEGAELTIIIPEVRIN